MQSSTNVHEKITICTCIVAGRDHILAWDARTISDSVAIKMEVKADVLSSVIFSKQKHGNEYA